MINIDFQGGSHGNYLEFVCNKFLGHVPTKGTPFNSLGASHNKIYLGATQYKADHYFDCQGKRTTPEQGKLISIRITTEDLLPLSSISLLRAGDYNLNNNDLEFNTFNKLNNIDYQWVLDNIINSFFKNQIEASYNAVRDPSWPDISSMDDFNKLPLHIRQECLEQHNLQLLELSETCPDCPRSVLIEFFKIGFKTPEKFGFMTQQEKMFYGPNVDVFNFPFGSFYKLDEFVKQVQNIAHWAGHALTDITGLVELHNEFLSKQPYKDSKIYCDQIFNDIVSNKNLSKPALDLLQESYLLAKLETYYNESDITSIDHYFQT